MPCATSSGMLCWLQPPTLAAEASRSGMTGSRSTPHRSSNFSAPVTEVGMQQRGRVSSPDVPFGTCSTTQSPTDLVLEHNLPHLSHVAEIST